MLAGAVTARGALGRNSKGNEGWAQDPGTGFADSEFGCATGTGSVLDKNITHTILPVLDARQTLQPGSIYGSEWLTANSCHSGEKGGLVGL